MARKSPDMGREKKLNQLSPCSISLPGQDTALIKLCWHSALWQMPANVRTKVRNFSELNYTDWCRVCAIPRSSHAQFLSANQKSEVLAMSQSEAGYWSKARGRDQDQVPGHESETEKVWQTVFTAWTITNWIFMKFTQMKNFIRV